MIARPTASLSRSLLPVLRSFSTSRTRQTKVAVLGAGGGIGQPLSLLLKADPLVSSLSLYDIRGAPGVAADVSHVDTAGEVNGYTPEKLGDALQGTKIVVIPAGVPRKPGMTRDDLFNTNALSFGTSLKPSASTPLRHIFSSSPVRHPVNSTVPIVAEVLKKAGKFNPAKLYGITTLDVVRASRFLSTLKSTNPADTTVTVVGGHSGITIVPLLSQSAIGKGVVQGSPEWAELVNRIQFGGDEVVKAKDGAGSATLSMAYAAAKFTHALLRAIGGEKGVITPSFVKSPLYESEGVTYFSSNVELGPEGLTKIHPLGQLSVEEEKLLQAALPELKKNIEKGVNFLGA
ncbi:hypothetical protein BS47DRAFT_1399658 [Hydnum rufescens UP504]|uniref:Malate dehydrogenase n=1 Tax=Hydnum rufescens UP504 TaxID=1448309 RepID=A0A9P6AJ52_9AGAM|nr:hypothetical protein BS47DRAFT_1399658 [Hydnum rufescens UP504]